MILRIMLTLGLCAGFVGMSVAGTILEEEDMIFCDPESKQQES